MLLSHLLSISFYSIKLKLFLAMKEKTGNINKEVNTEPSKYNLIKSLSLI